MTINELSENRPVNRVLVTGGAGSVGMEVLKELQMHKKWYQVKVLERNSPSIRRKLRPYKNDFQIIRGDICDPDVLKRSAEEVDFVIHLAAIIPPAADRDPDHARRINIEGTRLLIRAVEQHSPAAFFLFTSSISVYGDRVHNPSITVDDPLAPNDGDEYARTKIRAEQLVRSCSLNWSIFRLSAIMGPQTRMDPLFFHMPLDTSLEIATARDTGFALVEAIYHRNDIKGRTFNLSGGEKCRTSYRDFLSEVFRIMGLQKIDLPEKAFAQKNFHCGNYADAVLLNNILHFQQDTLKDFYLVLKNKSSGFLRLFGFLFPNLIRLLLLRKSDPWLAR